MYEVFRNTFLTPFVRKNYFFDILDKMSINNSGKNLSKIILSIKIVVLSVQ